MLRRLVDLQHSNGHHMVRIYGPITTESRGGTIPFNLLQRDGRVIDFRRVEAEAAARRISLRTGCFCNPGASETARGITAEDMGRVFALGRQPSLEAIAQVVPDKALGAVRVSPGPVTNERDLDRFIGLLEGFAD
jgi:selenocysteine lyase/cysteine desulfurase